MLIANCFITYWRLAFVADFGTQNIHLKTNFDMGNKTSNNHENGNNANRLLSAGLYTLKAHYIIGNRTGTYQTETIHYQRKGAISKFLKGSNMTWEDCVKSGWQVYKVDIVFQPCR